MGMDQSEKCELIITHKDELEDKLVGVFEERSPEVIGSPCLVLGTVGKEHWKASLDREGKPLGESLSHVTDFKNVLDFKLEGGWMPVNKPHLIEPEPELLPSTPVALVLRLQVVSSL